MKPLKVNVREEALREVARAQEQAVHYGRKWWVESSDDCKMGVVEAIDQMLGDQDNGIVLIGELARIGYNALLLDQEVDD